MFDVPKGYCLSLTRYPGGWKAEIQKRDMPPLGDPRFYPAKTAATGCGPWPELAIANAKSMLK